MYEKGLFEPDIVPNDYKPGYIVTSRDDGRFGLETQTKSMIRKSFF